MMKIEVWDRSDFRMRMSLRVSEWRRPPLAVPAFGTTRSGIVEREIQIQELILAFPHGVKDRTPESIRKYVDWLYHSRLPHVHAHSWEGTSSKQLLAKVNRHGNGVVFVRARRGKLRRKIKREFDAMMKRECLEVEELNRHYKIARNELSAYLMAIREPLYLAYDVESDTLFCSRAPHEREMALIKREVHTGKCPAFAPSRSKV